LPPSAAEYCFERHIIFEISRSEISKMMCLSKYNLARSAEKTFSHKLKRLLGAEGGELSCTLFNKKMPAGTICAQQA